MTADVQTTYDSLQHYTALKESREKTVSMHSGEVAPSQSLPNLAHRMATTEDPEVLAQLQDVVQMMLLCHNPDGMHMVAEHHRGYVGTEYEGSTPATFKLVFNALLLPAVTE